MKQHVTKQLLNEREVASTCGISVLTLRKWRSLRRFAKAIHDVGFGRFELLLIEGGEIVLDPWPTTVRGIKFGSADNEAGEFPRGDSELKAQVAEFFEYVRSVDSGQIRCLDVRHGLPFTMEFDHRPDSRGGYPDA